MSTYTYTISTDTANAKANSDSLIIEVRASAIVTALDYITISGDVLKFYFKASLSAGDQTTLNGIVAAHAGNPPAVIEPPLDSSGRPIYRPAAAKEGWHYQLLSVEVTTADKDGFYCKDDDGNNVGFITHKIYDVNGAEITDAANEGNATKTIFWVKPTHDYEIVGAIFGQYVAPTTNIYMFATGAPGIANLKFARGGINLKHAGTAAYQLANGRVAKYLQYYSAAPDANGFKFTLFHVTGVQHTFQLHLEIFKAP